MTHNRLPVLILFVFLFGLTALAQDKDWQPVTADLLSSKTPEVEADADAEAIFWMVKVDDSEATQLALKHYVRVKIYTERGREQFSKYDITFPKGTKVRDVEARVTKTDGTVVSLKKEDVIEREIIKANGFKVKAKSFAMPGLEVGAVLEYRYKEVLENSEANMRLVFQRDIPIRTISYYVRPFSGERAMYSHSFNTRATFQKDKDGYYRASMAAVPAFRQEPHMLPEDQVRSWMYIYYSYRESLKPAEYWKEINKSFYDFSKEILKPSDEVKTLTTQVINGAATDEEKLRKIYDYTKNEIKNLSYSTGVTDEERKKAQKIKNAGDVLKSKAAFSNGVDMLFGAMSRAAGFDARLALSGSRDELFFDPSIPHISLILNSSNIAIKLGDNWKFFSPAGRFVSYGMLSWQEEGQKALITDSKDPIWIDIPLSPAETSMEKRSGSFKLLEDGTLEGEAKIEFSGHWGTAQKRMNWDDSTVEQENRLKNLIKQNISGTTEVDKFTIENVSDPEKPFIYTFKIRVPGYGTRTGKRMFFQPNVFEHISTPEFTSSTRKYDVYINYPYASQDDIAIEIPKGFSLESPDIPSPIKDAAGIGSHSVQMSVSTDGRTLNYKRKFSFGNGGRVQFSTGNYGALKSMFEAFNKADMHQLTLRQDAVK